MADQLPGFVGDNAGDANTFLQQMFVNRRASPFGTSYKSMHEVGFNRRELSAVNQPPADGHPTRMEFKVSSTLGHLMHNMYFRVRFVIKPKTSTELHALLDGKSDAADGATRELSKLLDNVKLHPDGLLGCIDNIEMRHNSIVFQRLKRENMRLLRREQYNKEDHELQSRLINGGLPAYHALHPVNASLQDAPRKFQSDAAWGTLGGFRLKSYTHDKVEHYFADQDRNTDALNTRGYGGSYSNSTSDLLAQSDGYIKPREVTLEPPVRRAAQTQLAQVRDRVPHESKDKVYECYLPEFCHEIGLKDMPSEVLTNAAAGSKMADALALVRETGGWVFDQWFEVPHPWHYNTSDAFPILNLVNDMDVIFHLRPWQQWIQNYDMVQKLVDITMEPSKTDMLINYYDIPKSIWDDQFPLSRQMNHYAPDYQMHEEEIDVTVPIPTTESAGGLVDNVASTWHSVTGKDSYININTIDRVARYGILRLQGAEATRNSTYALEYRSWDVLSKAWLEVANEKLLTKVETDVDITKKYIERSQHFKELKNFVPGEIYYFPLGLDCDVHNPGGGVVNVRPFYNNFRLRMVFDPVKVDALYKSQQDHASLGDSATSLTVGTSASTDISNIYQNSTQSYKGLIQKNGSNYTMKLKVSFSCLVLDLVTYQNGQLFKQA